MSRCWGRYTPKRLGYFSQLKCIIFTEIVKYCSFMNIICVSITFLSIKSIFIKLDYIFATRPQGPVWHPARRRAVPGYRSGTRPLGRVNIFFLEIGFLYILMKYIALYRKILDYIVNMQKGFSVPDTEIHIQIKKFSRKRDNFFFFIYKV